MTFNHRGFSKETTFDSGPLAISGQKQLEDTSEIEWRIFYFEDRTTWVRLRLMLTSSTKSEQNLKFLGAPPYNLPETVVSRGGWNRVFPDCTD